MKRLSDAVAPLVARMTGENDIAARELRRAKVNDAWVRAVRDVFRDAAPFVFAHVNAVYVMSAEKGAAVRRFDRPASQGDAPSSGAVLVVYVDDSMVRSELDNRQELVKMKFRECGENVSSLKMVPSLRDMRKRHPFAHLAQPGSVSSQAGGGTPRPGRRPAPRVPTEAPSSGAYPGGRPSVSYGVASIPESDSTAAAEAVEDSAVRAALRRAIAACENRDREK